MQMNASQPMGRPHWTQFLDLASAGPAGKAAKGLPQTPQNFIPS
jgi:hypothetical protein